MEEHGERLIALLSHKTWVKHDLTSASHRPAVAPCNQLIKEVLFYLLLHPKTKSSQTLIKVLVETLSESLENTHGLAQDSLEHIAGNAKDPRLLKAIDYIEAHFGEDLQIEDLARKCGLSSRTFNRLLVSETGYSPKQWIIKTRISKAVKVFCRLPLKCSPSLSASIRAASSCL